MSWRLNDSAPATLGQDFDAPATPSTGVFYGGPASMQFAGGPPIVTGSATLSGVAALAAAALLLIPAAASPAASSNLTAGASVQVRAGASLVGSGALAGAALVQVRGTSSPAGSSSVAAVALVQVLAGAQLEGEGDLVATAEIDGEEAPPAAEAAGPSEYMGTSAAPWIPSRALRRAGPELVEGGHVNVSGWGALTAAGEVIPGVVTDDELLALLFAPIVEG